MAYPKWLPDSLIYQIYPQSFQDSNGDGIGDLRGIIGRLDYLQRLGVNTIWLTPCFDSPFCDAGYDIRDFYKIAARYGSEADMVALFDAAHERGIRVILDLVAGHTSMDHPWFEQEAKNPRDPNSNRYVWRNREYDPKAGPAKEDYLPSFFWHQPALNYGWEHPTEAWQDPADAPGPTKNREELKRILAYWFDRGADGFRVDMAATLVKHSLNGQGDGCQGNVELWQEMRGWLDEHYAERLLVAEWSCPDKALRAGFHLDFMMHFNAPGYPSLFFNGSGTIPAKEGPCYFDSAGEGSLAIFKKSYEAQLAACQGLGFVSLPTSNHDIQRPRCGARDWEGLRPLWVFLMTQAGVPSIYYGDEIGMRYVPDVEPKEGSTLLGIIADNAGTLNGERAGTRTPMQWSKGLNDGFSTASVADLYFPIDDDPSRPCVASQEADPDSLFHFVRRLILLRGSHPALGALGTYKIINKEGQSYPLVIHRYIEAEQCLIVVNPSGQSSQVDLLGVCEVSEALLCSGVQFINSEPSTMISVEPYGYGVFQLAKRILDQ